MGAEKEIKCVSKMCEKCSFCVCLCVKSWLFCFYFFQIKPEYMYKSKRFGHLMLTRVFLFNVLYVFEDIRAKV